jgi:hypothetical protein
MEISCCDAIGACGYANPVSAEGIRKFVVHIFVGRNRDCVVDFPCAVAEKVNLNCELNGFVGVVVKV